VPSDEASTSATTAHFFRPIAPRATISPLIQLSDLIIYTTRKFLECDNGYRENWSADAKNFYASCYDRVQKRMLADESDRRSG
jgi:hypothetical protein